MAKVNINGQSYEVDIEVAEQFSKFIRISKAKDKDIVAGLEREDGMLVAIGSLQNQLEKFTRK